MVNQMDNEVKILGYCAECDSEITTMDDVAFVDEEGNYYCCIDCILEHYAITRLEI